MIVHITYLTDKVTKRQSLEQNKDLSRISSTTNTLYINTLKSLSARLIIPMKPYNPPTINYVIVTYPILEPKRQQPEKQKTK